MKMVKSLLLGSAAGLVALTGAQAADLPVKAKPVEYVKICSLYGAGFYYIPGTDTCIRIGGHIRAEVSFNSRGTGIQIWNNDGSGTSTQTRDRDFFFTRSRSFLNVDTRTQTSFGTLRTFSVVRAEVNGPTGLAANAGVLGLDAALIQWGGFTVGRAGTSYFDNPWVYATKWGPNGSYGWPDTAGGRFVLAYTHQFGNGISGTLSLEDNKERKRGIYNGTNALTSFIGAPASVQGTVPGTDTRGGNTWPEIVGQLRIDQAWGGFHLAANVLNNHVAYNCGPTGTTTVAAGGCSELSGNPSDKVGGGVNAGFKFNTPWGVNDAFYIAGTWSKGALTDVFANIGQGSVFGLYGGSNGFLTYGSVTGSVLWDSVYTSTTRTGAGITVGPTGQQLTTGYGGSLAYEHGWNAEWRTSVFGGVQVVDYSDTANAILCSRAAGVLVNAVGASLHNTDACNFDYRIVGAGTRTYWTPVRDLTIGFEFMWSNHHAGFGDGAIIAQQSINNFKPNALYEVRDQNVFSGLFSVRRFF